MADRLAGQRCARRQRAGRTLDGDLGNDTLQGGASGDSLIGAGGIDFASYAGSATGVTVSIGNPALNSGEAIGDTYSSIEGVIGSAFADTLSGSALVSDTLYGGGGDDQLSGSGTGAPGDPNADTLYGGVGIDRTAFNGSALSITLALDGSAGSGGNAQGDRLFEMEWLIGSQGNDVLGGSGGVDTLDGDIGNDTVTGGAGNDLLIGGNGDDTLEGGIGGDTLQGGAGMDAASWANAGSAVTFSLVAVIPAAGEAAGDSTNSIEVFIGSAHDDFIGGAGLVLETFFGGDGNDFLSGGGQFGTPGAGGQDASGDVYHGGNAVDRTAYSAGSGSVTIDLAAGMGFGGNAQNDRFFSIEHVAGSFETDTMIGSAGVDTLDGFDANDTLAGGAGNDLLIGGAGDDTLEGGIGGDAMFGGAGTDAASWANAASGITFAPSMGTTSGPEALGDTIDSIEVYIGSAFDDLIVGAAAVAETFYGGLGNDYLSGNGVAGPIGDASGDTLYGGAGLDATGFNAGSGSVTVDLAAGRGWGSNAENDRFFSIEHVIGSMQNDTLTGSGVSETLDGFNSNDTIVGAGGDDWIIGGAGDDLLLGSGGGADRVDGGDGNDIINDTSGSDTVFGGNGNDTVQYFSGSSYQLSGGLGVDTPARHLRCFDNIDLASGAVLGRRGRRRDKRQPASPARSSSSIYFTVTAPTCSGTSTPAGVAISASPCSAGRGTISFRCWMATPRWAAPTPFMAGTAPGQDLGRLARHGRQLDRVRRQRRRFIYSGGGTAAPGGYDDTLYGGEGFDYYYWSPNNGGFGKDIIHDSSAGGNGLIVFSGNTAPAGGFPDTGSPDNDPVNGRVTLVDLGGGWFKIEDKADPANSIQFRGGDITVINLQSRPVPGVPGETSSIPGTR